MVQALSFALQFGVLFLLLANVVPFLRGIHKVELDVRKPRSPLEFSLEHALQQRVEWRQGIPELGCRFCDKRFLPHELYVGSYRQNICSMAPRQPLMWYLTRRPHFFLAPWASRWHPVELGRVLSALSFIQQAKLEEAFRAKT